MARMIPPQAPIGSPNEGLVYDILKDCPGTQDWTVLHQLDFTKHVTQAMGEADAIICVPGCAVVFLEVKGYVEFENGQWYFGGNPDPKPSPFRQARGAMFSIKDWIEEEAPELLGMPMAFGAVFAQTQWDGVIPDASPHQLIDCRSVDHRQPELLRIAIKNLGGAEVQKLGALSPPVRFANGEPSEGRIERFVELLRPSVHPPHILVSSVWSRVLRFTREQFAALDDSKFHRQMIFKGLAGTGKTVLATQLATTETLRGRTVLFICFTQLAREKVNEATASLRSFSARGVIDLALEMIKLSQGQQVANLRAEELRQDPAAFERVLNDAAANADKVPECRKYDLLIVDEAQDVMADEFLAIVGAWLKDGLEDGNWVMFLDQNQWIFSKRRLDLQSFLDRFPDCRVRHLWANCRNTERIAMFANAHALLKEPEWFDRLLVKHRTEELHPQPIFRYYSDDEDQERQVTSHMLALMDSGIPPNEIVLLSASKEQSCALRIRAKGFESLLMPYTLGETGHVRFETIHRFKGLESFCVLVTDINELPGTTATKPIRELLYTAITRAVFRLDCFAHEKLQAQLDRVEVDIG